MDAISWMCGFVDHLWSVFGDNSGQIQIVIAIGAIGLAFMAYRKVLEQIGISNKQTKISREQIDRLNKERLFEVILRLKGLIWEMEEKFDQLVADYIEMNMNLLTHGKKLEDISSSYINNKINENEELNKIRQIQSKLSEYSINTIMDCDDIIVMENNLKEVFKLNGEYNHYRELLRVKELMIKVEKDRQLLNEERVEMSKNVNDVIKKCKEFKESL